MKPINVNALPDGSGVIIERQVQVVELGADSKRLLMEIRDRLPATTPRAPDGMQLWEMFGPREQAVLCAWLTPENQVAWVKKGMIPKNGLRPLYVRNAL